MDKIQGTVVIDPAALAEKKGSGYPAPFEEPCTARSKVALGDAGGLTQYGVNLVTLEPGAWSAQRHWHSHEDEFVWVVSGELTLVSDAGETLLKPGMAATSKAGVADGHHLVNRSNADAVYLVVFVLELERGSSRNHGEVGALRQVGCQVLDKPVCCLSVVI